MKFFVKILYILRYCWTHGITPRKSDVTSRLNGKMTLVERKRRTSFTFRRLLRKACDCSFPHHCDSQQEQLGDNKSLEINSDETAAKLEKLHVHQVIFKDWLIFIGYYNFST